MSFSEDQIKALQAKLAPAHVKKNPKGFDYIEGWKAIELANEIFGHDGWNRETLEMEWLHQPYKNSNDNVCVSYRARVRITVGGVVRDGTGFGNGWAASETDAHESAVKEAETDAMKRALMTFGNPFGLALYDKKKENVATPADAYVEATLRLINSSRFNNREEVTAWWQSPETEAEQKKNGLNPDHYKTLMAEINKRFPAEKKEPA